MSSARVFPAVLEFVLKIYSAHSLCRLELSRQTSEVALPVDVPALPCIESK